MFGFLGVQMFRSFGVGGFRFFQVLRGWVVYVAEGFMSFLVFALIMLFTLFRFFSCSWVWCVEAFD